MKGHLTAATLPLNQPTSLGNESPLEAGTTKQTAACNSNKATALSGPS